MIRHHQSIRLTRIDQALFAALTGPGLPPPTTVVDYNHRLVASAHAWRQGTTPNEHRLAALAEGLLLDENDETSVIDRDMLREARQH